MTESQGSAKQVLMLEDNFIAQQKTKLLAERDELEVQLRQLHMRVDSNPQDVDDLAEASEELSTRSGEAEALEKRLRAINLALEKVEHGSYGICEHCRSYIDKAQLQTDPAVTHCERCTVK